MLGIGVIISFALKNVNSISGATGMMSKLFTEAGNGHQVLSKLGKSLVAVAAAAALVKTGMAGINATMGNVQAYADYETEMAHVQGLLNISRDGMRVLEDQATSLAQTTRFTRGEIMQSYWELLSAGFDVSEVMSMINGTLMVSVSGHMETAEAVNVLTSALLGFGYTADDTVEVLDVLQTYIRYTKIHWSDYAASLGRFSSTAAATNQTLEETSAMFGLIMSRGLPAARSATLLRVMLSQLQEVGGRPGVIEALESAGVNIIDPLTGSFRHLVDIMDDINRAFPSLAELPQSVLTDEMNITEAAFERLGLLGDIFGRRGIAGFYAAITASQKLNGTMFEGTDVLRELIRLGEEESSGALLGYYSAMLDTHNEKLGIIKSTWVTIREQLGAPLLDAISPVLTHINNALTTVSQFLTAHPEVAKAIGSALAIASALLLVAGAFVGLVAVIAILGAIGAGALVIALKVVAVIAIIGGIIAAIVAVIILYGDAVYNWFKTRIWPILKPILLIIGAIIVGVSYVVVSLITPIITFLVIGFMTIWNIIDSILLFVSGILTGDIPGAIEAIKGVWEGFAGKIQSVFDFFGGMLDGFLGVIQDIYDWIQKLLPGGDDVKDIFDWIQKVLPGGYDFSGHIAMAQGMTETHAETFAAGTEYVPRDGYYRLHEGEGVFQAGGSSQEKTVSLSIGNFSININSSGNNELDGERIGKLAIEYMNENLSRVMA